MDCSLEIEWRKLLIARLSPVLTRLNKVSAAEKAVEEERTAEIRALYPTEEAAHDAFGYGEITEDEYRSIVEGLNVITVSATSAARDELKSIMACLRRQIKDLEWEMLPEAEKDRIKQSNERYRDELKQRRDKP